MTKNYEDQAERRLRKVNDIKTKFWKRLAEEQKKEDGLGRMAIYREIADQFYLSESEIRHIIAGRR